MKILFQSIFLRLHKESCELRVRCMLEPIADALLTLNGKEIGSTNSSGFLNYSYPGVCRYVINASKTGYRSANRILIVQENSSASSVKSAVSEPSSNSGKEKVARSEPQIPGFRGITVVLLLIFFIRRRSSL
jgi:TolB protein